MIIRTFICTRTANVCFTTGLLKTLVTKLRPMLFLSGDYVCKKGDVGKEMFIVTTGQVQVVGGPDDSIVFVTLGKGSYLFFTTFSRPVLHYNQL